MITLSRKIPSVQSEHPYGNKILPKIELDRVQVLAYRTNKIVLVSKPGTHTSTSIVRRRGHEDHIVVITLSRKIPSVQSEHPYGTKILPTLQRGCGFGHGQRQRQQPNAIFWTTRTTLEKTLHSDLDPLPKFTASMTKTEKRAVAMKAIPIGIAVPKATTKAMSMLISK